ncbi:MAG: hypothetical protein OEU36_22855 [Gammaproteobacteria bacterium]|nr:hypothetical protein [Gammaproteobacteria bacterium]
MKTICIMPLVWLVATATCYGKVGDTTYKILQIIDDNNMLVTVSRVTGYSVSGTRFDELGVEVLSEVVFLID